MKLLILLALFALSTQSHAAPPATAANPTGEDRWKGTWTPAPEQGFIISEDFRLHFGEDYPLHYLRDQSFELHLQEGNDNSVGAEATVENRRLIFLLFPDDADPKLASLVIYRVDKIDGERKEKILVITHFRRDTAPAK